MVSKIVRFGEKWLRNEESSEFLVLSSFNRSQCLFFKRVLFYIFNAKPT